jgi:hypothetical protein
MATFMWITRRAGLVVALATVLALLAVQGALADQTYSDPVGDSGSAPDITAVAVGNDDVGNYTFRITTNQPDLATDAVIFAYIDSDVNSATGWPHPGLGADYFFVADRDGGVLFHVVGNIIEIEFDSTFSASYAAGTLTARVNRADLGGTERFVFFVEAEQSDANGVTIAADRAPGVPAFFEYAPARAALVLSVGKPVGSPGRPTAGKPFTVAAPVSRSDGQPFSSGKVTCRVKVGAKPLRAAGRVANQSTRCSMTIPRNAKGSVLRGTLTVSAGDAKPVARSFSFRIR